MHANMHVHTHVFVLTFRAGIPAQDGGCYLALDSVTYQASCQASQGSFVRTVLIVSPNFGVLVYRLCQIDTDAKDKC
jgi:hypothetical protein